MKIYSDTKIYMMCPANIHSGGPELCHQLVSQLVQFGLDAYLYYLPNSKENFKPEKPVDSFYTKYHLPWVLEIEDKPQNILIMNESANWSYYIFQRIRKVFWWMSVDNYIRDISKIISNTLENPLASVMPRFFYFQKDETEHWVQSEYARLFLKLNGIPKKQIYMVEDYLNQAFLGNADKIDISEKKDVVAFNPAKGINVTRQLVKLAPKIVWFPIKNMTPEQVQKLLSMSKIYIDFGNHPGKDRIPREAALSGCVIITGKRGAAGNDIDINIPAEFKFDENTEDFPKIIEKITNVFENFEENYNKQQDYRTRILDDKPRFAKEVAAALELKPPEIEFLALSQGISEKSLIFIDTMLQNDLIPDFIVDDKFCTPENLSENAYIKIYQNTNYYFPPDFPKNKIMIISTADAKFLYAEGRISKFILLNPEDEEINSTAEKFNATSEDVLSVNFE